jgi:hypothetical protein
LIFPPKAAGRLSKLSRLGALDETHVDDFVILDIRLENTGVHHHGLVGINRR